MYSYLSTCSTEYHINGKVFSVLRSRQLALEKYDDIVTLITLRLYYDWLIYTLVNNLSAAWNVLLKKKLSKKFARNGVCVCVCHLTFHK